jgi:uncharacterized membrane protein YkvA (DUF1232 family)
VPDCLVLARRLLSDRRVPRRAKLAVAVLVAYLAMPVDLVPDFIPVVGQLDDAVVAVVCLRYVGRVVPPDVLAELWPGSPRGLALLRSLIRRR